MLCLIGLVAWGGVMVQGHYLFGADGVLTFGALFGISIFLLLKMVDRWSKWSVPERGGCALALLLSLSGGIYVTIVDFGYGFHITQQKVREAQRLQDVLRADPRHESVIVTYEDPRRDKKGQWLWVRGSVPNEQALDELHRMLDDKEKWFVRWEVDVVAR